MKRISLTNDNVLTYYGEHGAYPHSVHRSRDPKSEVVIVWGLTDLIEVLPGFESNDYEEKRVEQLRELAEKKMTDAKGGEGGGGLDGGG